MLLKVCPWCRGDGFYRKSRHEIDPLTNIACARPIRSVVKQSGDVLYDYARSITGYEFDCRKCDGVGEIRWQRGHSLTPITA